ncbi:class I SAM-dependent rRNA methyltransferase [Enterococcus xiangfangensis]|uniref:Class I SAM-dependent rRNA methyltransferase n=1 Tax=Enterococcus xiangfangensis TaxID=1296537 RepID=A0ABU3FDE7_9ENTE|nr:class I SAM-dependent rRNA methyltransferase [Enterococcus xiangfangensis]MDT2760710.1 class I SAM-dependent rRNA methyltransferase [Enterococcus xiangfangensis]
MSVKIELTNYGIKRIRQGNPLIQEEDLKQSIKKIPLEWVEFVDNKHKYVATGYLGKQNKGFGWVIDQTRRGINQDFLAQKFQQAIQKRQVFFSDETTTAFRLFNGEGDGFGGMTIDYYADYLVISWYNQTIYHFQKMIVASLLQVFPTAKGLVEKIRFKSELLESRWLAGEKPEEPLIVMENGVSYAVYLDEGYMTGIFLDQKEVRGRLTEGLAAGKKVLNMFSYTGAFSVAAAYGGALETTSVDLAQRSLAKTQEQFEVNGLPLEQQKIIVMDTFDYFRYAGRKNLTYDVIILDPPSFARNKKKTFSVAKDYGRLIEDSVDILADDGLIIASTNAANLSIKKFKYAIETALQNKKVDYQLVESYRLPADFPASDFEESNYLKVLFYTVKK